MCGGGGSTPKPKPPPPPQPPPQPPPIKSVAADVNVGSEQDKDVKRRKIGRSTLRKRPLGGTLSSGLGA